MSWETRQRGGRYYTRSRRIEGRILREYIGTGPLAEAIATLDEVDRSADARERAQWRAEREPIDEAWQELRAIGKAVQAAVRASLEGAGFKYHRGEWRAPRRKGLEAADG